MGLSTMLSALDERFVCRAWRSEGVGKRPVVCTENRDDSKKLKRRVMPRSRHWALRQNYVRFVEGELFTESDYVGAVIPVEGGGRICRVLVAAY